MGENAHKFFLSAYAGASQRSELNAMTTLYTVDTGYVFLHPQYDDDEL